MSNRPEVDLALDVRSWESVIVLAAEDGTYPTHWVRPNSATALQEALSQTHCVVVADRVDVTPKTMARIGVQCPRLVAFIPLDRDQEIAVRRLVTAMYPWARTWDHSTSLGKAIVYEGIGGAPYDRDAIMDMRTPAVA